MEKKVVPDDYTPCYACTTSENNAYPIFNALMNTPQRLLTRFALGLVRETQSNLYKEGSGAGGAVDQMGWSERSALQHGQRRYKHQ